MFSAAITRSPSKFEGRCAPNRRPNVRELLTAADSDWPPIIGDLFVLSPVTGHRSPVTPLD
jgi:hypothetical protein